MSGFLPAMAIFAARQIFSPVDMQKEPPKKLKFVAQNTTGSPSIVPFPVMNDEAAPVLWRAASILCG